MLLIHHVCSMIDTHEREKKRQLNSRKTLLRLLTNLPPLFMHDERVLVVHAVDHTQKTSLGANHCYLVRAASKRTPLDQGCWHAEQNPKPSNQSLPVGCRLRRSTHWAEHVDYSL